jgi:predicted type IV restriction endonuclease
LIQPLFTEIGWDFTHIDNVEPEFPVLLEGENKPADYALKFEGKVCAFLEAKGINVKIDVAIKDGAEKAIKENVPWVISTNGDAIAVLIIDQSIPEEERGVFQAALSDSVEGEQTLDQFIAYMQLLTPEAIQSGNLKKFAEQKLKETRITNILKTTLDKPH